MKKNLYYYNWQLQKTVFAVVLDDIKERYGLDEIYFLSCKGSLLPCQSNLEMDEAKCKLCRFNQEGAFRDHFEGIKHLYIDDYSSIKEVDFLFKKNQFDSYKSVNAIKSIQFRGVSIGYGALSTYISATRNKNPELDKAFRTYFDRLLKVEIFIKVALDRIIDEIHPDVITIFNGRIHDTRPVYQTAINLGIPLRGVETVVKGKFELYRRVFKNSLPHGIRYHTEEIKRTWNESKHSIAQRYDIAASFYNGRRNKQLIRDVKVYTSNQINHLLPNDFDEHKHNIAIFNSSEDEFAAIGEEWEYLSLFASQEEGIKWLLENTKDDSIHFYLRVHPNLKEVSYGYHERLYALEGYYSNITVISADSQVSTYALMDAVDKVVVFGSSAGIEAAYSCKPVILLGGTFYYYLEATYNPDDVEELRQLIFDEKLSPKATDGAIKFAYYLMVFESYCSPITNNIKEFQLFGKTLFHYLPDLTLLHSSFLHKLGEWILRFYLSFLDKRKKITIPKKEATSK